MTLDPLRRLLGLASVACLTLILTMTMWALLPLAVGLRSAVVMSGSMQPRIRPGDVVVTLPRAAAKLRPGQVIAFTDPSDPGRELTHRLVRRTADGSLVTRGDANTSEDSTPVPPSLVHGLAVLRVPYVGLPAYWLRTGDYLPVGLFGAVVLVLITAATDPRRDERRRITRPPARTRGMTPYVRVAQKN